MSQNALIRRKFSKPVGPTRETPAFRSQTNRQKLLESSFLRAELEVLIRGYVNTGLRMWASAREASKGSELRGQRVTPKPSPKRPYTLFKNFDPVRTFRNLSKFGHSRTVKNSSKAHWQPLRTTFWDTRSCAQVLRSESRARAGPRRPFGGVQTKTSESVTKHPYTLFKKFDLLRNSGNLSKLGH